MPGTGKETERPIGNGENGARIPRGLLGLARGKPYVAAGLWVGYVGDELPATKEERLDGFALAERTLRKKARRR